MRRRGEGEGGGIRMGRMGWRRWRKEEMEEGRFHPAISFFSLPSHTDPNPPTHPNPPHPLSRPGFQFWEASHLHSPAPSPSTSLPPPPPPTTRPALRSLSPHAPSHRQSPCPSPHYLPLLFSPPLALPLSPPHPHSVSPRPASLSLRFIFSLPVLVPFPGRPLSRPRVRYSFLLLLPLVSTPPPLAPFLPSSSI